VGSLFYPLPGLIVGLVFIGVEDGFTVVPLGFGFVPEGLVDVPGLIVVPLEGFGSELKIEVFGFSGVLLSLFSVLSEGLLIV
jgi:hypothetical protein